MDGHPPDEPEGDLCRHGFPSSTWPADILSNEDTSDRTAHPLAKSSWDGCTIVQKVSLGTRGYSLWKFRSGHYAKITLGQLMRKAATVRNTQVTLSGKTPLELANWRRPRDLMDAASSGLVDLQHLLDLLDRQVRLPYHQDGLELHHLLWYRKSGARNALRERHPLRPSPPKPQLIPIPTSDGDDVQPPKQERQRERSRSRERVHHHAQVPQVPQIQKMVAPESDDVSDEDFTAINPSLPSVGPPLAAEQEARSRRNERSRSRERMPPHSSSLGADEDLVNVDLQNRVSDRSRSPQEQDGWRSVSRERFTSEIGDCIQASRSGEILGQRLVSAHFKWKRQDEVRILPEFKAPYIVSSCNSRS